MRSTRSRSTGRRGSEVHPLSVDGPAARSARRSASRTPSRRSPGRWCAQGAGFLVVTVNNASYGTTAASAQHLQISRMRAVENGRWVVQRRGLRDQRVHRPHRPRGGLEGLFEPAILRHTIRSSDASERGTSGWGTGSPGSRWRSWSSCSRSRGVARRSARDPEPLSRGLPDPRHPAHLRGARHDRAVLIGVRKAPQDVDVLVVDDSSPDGTGQVVGRDRRDRSARPPPGAPGASRGSPAPTWTGSASAWPRATTSSSRWTRTCPTIPTELPRLLEAAAAGKDLVVGSRYVPGGSVTNWSRLARGVVAGRQPLRAHHAGPAGPRRHQWLPRLPAARCSRTWWPSRSPRTATGSRSSS